MTETERIFKENLILLRKNRNLTGYKLAKELKIDRTYYYNLEKFSKEQSPTYELLEKIAGFYNIEVWQLFKKNGDNTYYDTDITI